MTDEKIRMINSAVENSDMLILAIDFDGTLVRNDPTTHDILEPIWDVVNTVKKAFEKGHTMILWTARQGKRETEAVEYCKNVLGLDFKYVNENCPAAKNHDFGDARKIYADFYLDNKALTTWESLKAII